MSDVRDDILERLNEVVATIPNLKSNFRNNVDITDEDLPSVVVFDADEETVEIGNKPSNSPVIVQMTPEIVIVEMTEGQVGTELAVMRRALIRLVLTDTELNALVSKTSPRGEAAIRYLGSQTDVGWMRSLHGALRAQFLFKYLLKPDEL